MPEVSVIMNCYNGEKYLRDAIDSVFRQTFTDWELIFVDNCSEDASIEIASAYGDKVKIIRNVENIPLGQSRNVGLSNSFGKYISFLDVDDIWFESTLEVQLEAIKSGDYAIAYGGHENINAKGDRIGKMMPMIQKGYVFSELLEQFDIPIVTTMLSRKCLQESGLMFDVNIFASEEYCLFMQLAAKFQFIAIDGLLTRYRIHDDALTNKTISKWAKERRYTLDKIRKENPELEKKFKKAFEEAYARAAYYEAQYLMSQGSAKLAAKALGPFKFQRGVYFMLYFIIYFCPFMWTFTQRIKYKRSI